MSDQEQRAHRQRLVCSRITLQDKGFATDRGLPLWAQPSITTNSSRRPSCRAALELLTLALEVL